MRRGTVERLLFESRVLRGNPLGDPHVRDTPVYLPPDYGERHDRRYPTVFVLTGFTGTATFQLNVKAWGESLPERLDRLIGTKKMRPAIVVMADNFTKFGGAQYLNSPATGRYADHLIDELVPYVDRRYRTLPSAGSRAVMGKSSGGYGAIIHAMRRPDVFGLVACHSGDMLFELSAKADFGHAAQAFDEAGGVREWMKRFEAAERKDRLSHSALNMVAMAMAYSPLARPRKGLSFELPFDERTGVLDERVWKRWLANDPVVLADRYAARLKMLRLLYLDCGTKDEYHLQFGARALSAKLKKLGVSHVHEEFPDGHRDITYRYDRSLPLISKAFV